MVDTVDKATRSRIMSSIRSKNTRPEILVRKLLHGQGFRFRLHDRRLPCKPDIVLRRHRVCLFVNGCFWHRHQGCKLSSIPASNSEYWENKFAENVERDRAGIERLLADGWRVGVIWECSVRSGSYENSLLKFMSNNRKKWETKPAK